MREVERHEYVVRKMISELKIEETGHFLQIHILMLFVGCLKYNGDYYNKKF